jgi:hypothetical protein
MKTLMMRGLLRSLGLGGLLLHFLLLMLVLFIIPDPQVDLEDLLHPALFQAATILMLPLSALLNQMGSSWTILFVAYLLICLLSNAPLLLYCFSSCSSLLLLLPSLFIQTQLLVFLAGVSVFLLFYPVTDIPFILILFTLTLLINISLSFLFPMLVILTHFLVFLAGVGVLDLVSTSTDSLYLFLSISTFTLIIDASFAFYFPSYVILTHLPVFFAGSSAFALCSPTTDIPFSLTLSTLILLIHISVSLLALMSEINLVSRVLPTIQPHLLSFTTRRSSKDNRATSLLPVYHPSASKYVSWK